MYLNARCCLHLYLEAWVKESGVSVYEAQFKKVKGKNGWLAAYLDHFSQQLNIDVSGASINLRLLEEVVLARNLVEHPPTITNLRPHFSKADLKEAETSVLR